MPAAPSSGLPARPVLLPVLRRPPGWALLDERAVRVRAAQLLQACLEPHSVAPTGAEIHHPRHAQQPPPTLHAPRGHQSHQPRPLRAKGVTHSPAATSPARPAAPAGAADTRRGRLWRYGPALLWAIGLVVIAPWLVWAPLVGGLCLGILLIQTGLLRRWLALQKARVEPHEVQAMPVAAEDAARAEAGVGVVWVRVGADTLKPIRSVEGLKVPALRWAHGGWLLMAGLALLGVQAAMVIATVQIGRTGAALPVGAARPALDKPAVAGMGARTGAQEAILGLTLIGPPAAEPSVRPAAGSTGQETGR